MNKKIKKKLKKKKKMKDVNRIYRNCVHKQNWEQTSGRGDSEKQIVHPYLCLRNKESPEL